MKKFRKVLALLLAAVMTISCSPLGMAAQSGFAKDGSGSVSEINTNGPLSLTKGNGALSLDAVKPNSNFAPNYNYPQSSTTIKETGLTKFEPGEWTPFSKSDAAVHYSATDTVTFIVVTEERPLLEMFSVSEIAGQTASVLNHELSQMAVINRVTDNVVSTLGEDAKLGFTYTVATTGFSVTTEYGNKAALEAMPGVKTVYVAPTFAIPEDVTSTELEPMTNNATTMIGAEILNASGYTGRGMRVAILDTGLNIDHPNFEALPEDVLVDPMTRESVEAIWDTLNASQLTHMINTSYKSNKIPFAFNYAAGDFDVRNTYAGSDHGTHVAGITAANKIEGSSVIGVAPDAQVIVMQVFQQGGGASWDTVMAALEDCVRLEVDAANLSLGAAAGFTDSDSAMLEAMNLFLDSDIQVLIASGNDTNNALMNSWGLHMSLITDPDNGLAGTPSTYSAALAVASANNDGEESIYFTVDGKDIAFYDTATTREIIFLNNFINDTLEYVVVPGVGEEGDYEGLDVTGKVALVSRGVTSFPEKQKIAQEHGAIACVVYNNTLGSFGMQINDTAEDIPCVSISREAGQHMIAAAGEDGIGSLTVCDGSVKVIKSDRTMSSFSSWGVTPDLKLKPEITGVGGNIYSTVDPNISGSWYGTMSGTSMATPQITGAMAVLIQYLDENYPEITGAEQRKLAANLLMSTADPIMVSDLLPYSPRNQGAGLANLVSATTSPAYLSNPNASESRPKAELGDNPSRTGVYEFSFEITNLSDEALIYEFDSTIMSEAITSGYFISNSPYGLEAEVSVGAAMPGTPILRYDFNDDGVITTADARALLLHIAGIKTIGKDSLHYQHMDINNDGAVSFADARVITDYCAGLDVAVDMSAVVTLEVNQVSVPANSTVTLSATLALTENDKAYVEQFPNGIFVEGYLYAKNIKEDAEGAAVPTLVMPIVGFYGDWSDAPIFDDPVNYSLYPSVVFSYYSELGQNPYFRNGKGGEEYSAISYSNPIAEIDFGQMRNAKYMTFTVTDIETGEEYFFLEGAYLGKTYFNQSYGQIIPTWLAVEYGEVWDGMDKKGNKLPDGTTVEYKIDAWLDDGDDIIDDSWTFTTTLDTSYPEIVNQYELQESLTVEGDRTYLTLEIMEQHHIAALIFLSPDGIIMGKYEVDNTPGELYTNKYDITGFGGEFTIIVADYACNETELDVVLNLGDQNNVKPQPVDLSNDRLYGCETFDSAIIEAGWFSVDPNNFDDVRNETYDSTNRYYAAEYVNGYIIAQNANTGALVLVTPSNTHWSQQTLLENNGQMNQPNVWLLYDMALDHSASEEYEGAKDKLYAVGWLYKGDNNNDGHDDGYNALFEITMSEDGYNNVNAIGRITGVNGDMLTLGITTEGDMYGIDTDGILYSINPEPVWDDSLGEWGDYAIETTFIGATDFREYPNYGGANVIQSMGYDHNTGKMYWYAHSQVPDGYYYANINVTYEVDLTTGKCTEVGTYGAGGQTCLFVPNDLVSNLFSLEADPNGFEIAPYQMTLVEGQTSRLNINWRPWNATVQDVTWASSDETIAIVDEYGFVTAVGEGTAYIEATSTVYGGEWIVEPDGQWVWVEGWKEVTNSAIVTVKKSESALYGYVVSDFRNRENDFTWITYGDQTLQELTQIGKQEIISIDPMSGESYVVPALWQGGTYYNGYVYTVVKDARDDGTGAYGAATILYRSKVTKGETPEQTVIGEPEEIGYTLGIEVGNIAFDYNTGRMYGVDLTYGGLVIIDLDTGALDQMGTFSGDCGGPIIATAMCVMADGTIVIADMYSNLYTVDADTLNTTMVYDGSADSWFYGAMTYDYNTGSIYWNPCMDANQSPLNLVYFEWGRAQVINLGSVSSKAGVEQTVLFTIPDEEPETNIIRIEGIEIAEGEATGGLAGGSKQLHAVTTPERPTVRAKVWTSADESIATVDQFGTVTFISVGTTTITVTTTDKTGDVFTDSIEVTVLPAAGEMQAFLSYDDGGSGYYDFWISMNDYDLRHAKVGQSMISIYSLRVGTYYDGYYYGYTDTGAFLRINANDPADYKVLGQLNRDVYVDKITSMAVDYTTGTVYGLTMSHRFGYQDRDYNYIDGHLGELVTIDLDTGLVTTVATLDRYVYALACHVDGTLYAAGANENDDVYADAVLYTLDKDTAESTYVTTIAGAQVYTGNNYYGTVMYNPQMTCDFTTNRLYLNATSDEQGLSYSTGMYMIQLGDEITITNLGGISLYIREGSDIKYGHVFLGLLEFIPEADELPVGTVNGIILNKTAGRVAVDGTAQLTASVRPSNVLDDSVTWTTSDSSIATVDQNGLVTGISAGTVEITVTSNENPAISNTCVMTVVEVIGNQSVAYTVSAQQGALISFNPALPAQTAEVIGNFNGGGNLGGMAYGEDCLYYVLDINYMQYLYRYDFLTKQHTELGMLNMWSPADDIAYDAENGLLYAVAGFYLFQFDINSLVVGNMAPYTNYMQDPDFCNIAGVEVDEDGNVYTIGTGLYSGDVILRRYDARYLSNPTVINGDVALNVVPNATDMGYDASCGLFYITDAGHTIYIMDMEGNVEMVDLLGDGIDMYGLTIIPAVNAEAVEEPVEESEEESIEEPVEEPIEDAIEESVEDIIE